MRFHNRLRTALSVVLAAGLLLSGIPVEFLSPNQPLVKQAYAADSGTVSTTALAKTIVDFSISSSDLVCKEESSSGKGGVRAGVKLKLQANVKKITPSVSGGGKVSFVLDGQLVDKVPFFFEKTVTQQVVSSFCSIPLDKYAGLSKGQKVPLLFEARVEPDALTSDPNAGNDSAQFNISVIGSDPDASFTQSTEVVSRI